MKKKMELKLGMKTKGACNTLQDLKESKMPLRISMASGKTPAIGINSSKKKKK